MITVKLSQAAIILLVVACIYGLFSTENPVWAVSALLGMIVYILEDIRYILKNKREI